MTSTTPPRTQCRPAFWCAMSPPTEGRSRLVESVVARIDRDLEVEVYTPGREVRRPGTWKVNLRHPALSRLSRTLLREVPNILFRTGLWQVDPSTDRRKGQHRRVGEKAIPETVAPLSGMHHDVKPAKLLEACFSKSVAIGFR